MKKIIVSLTAVFCFAGIHSFAQCDKKLLLTSSKTEYLDTAGNITRSVNEKSTVEIKEKEIVIAAEGNPTMTGSYKVESCNWAAAFKKGKSVYTAHFEQQGQEDRNIIITIEGKDGKISFVAKIKERPDRIIRLYPDKFEEVK